MYFRKQIESPGPRIDEPRGRSQSPSDPASEMRDALWACVESAHQARHTDRAMDDAVDEQIARIRAALVRLGTSSVKDEFLAATAAIERALASRRDEQRELHVGLVARIDRLGRRLEDARCESTTDPLTGLGNRAFFDMMARRAIALSSLSGQPVVLLVVDIDALRAVNDVYGHEAGDAAVTGVARELTRLFMRQTDLVCRTGGGEFAALLAHTDARVALDLARRLQERIAEMPAPHPRMEFAVGASVGVAQLEAFDGLGSWVARAEGALRKAKRKGRERVSVAEGATMSAG